MSEILQKETHNYLLKKSLLHQNPCEEESEQESESEEIFNDTSEYSESMNPQPQQQQDTQKEPTFYFASSHELYRTINPKDFLHKTQHKILQLSHQTGKPIGKSLHTLIEPENNLKISKTNQKIQQKTIFNQNSQNQQLPHQITSNECPVCSIVLDEKNRICLKCNHFACKSCYSAYIKHQIQQIGDQILQKTCIQKGCQEILDDTVFSTLDLKTQSLITNFQIKLAVESEKSSHYCPNPRCDSIIVNNRKTITENPLNSIMCQKCKIIFCISCKKEAHYPLNCDQARQISSILLENVKQNDLLSETWINLNTKQCPRCSINIQKLKGCHHMKCSNCRYSFCWKCLEDWAGHANYFVCNEPEKNIQDQIQEKIGKNQNQSFNYQNIDEFSQKFLQYKLKIDNFSQKMNQKIENCQTFLASIGNLYQLDFFSNLLDYLREIKLIIAYSYIHCQSLSEQNQGLFKFQLGYVEEKVEILKSSLENADVSNFYDHFNKTFKDQFQDWKLFIQDLKYKIEKNMNKIIIDTQIQRKKDEFEKEKEQILLEQQFSEYHVQLMEQEEQERQISLCCICQIQPQYDADSGLCLICINDQCNLLQQQEQLVLQEQQQQE